MYVCSRAEAAKELNLKPSEVRRLLEQGLLRSVEGGGVNFASVQAYKASNQTSTQQAATTVSTS